MRAATTPQANKAPNVRLTPSELDSMRQVFQRVLGAYPQCSVMLYGSRADPNKRGGDIDLLVHVPGIAPGQVLNKELELGARLQQELGEQRIDITLTTAINGPNASAFVKLIVAEAVTLWP